MNKYLEILLNNNKKFMEDIKSIAFRTKEKIDNYCVEKPTLLTIELIQESEYEFAAILDKETLEYNSKNKSNLKSNVNYSEMFNSNLKNSICFLFNFNINNNVEGLNINVILTDSNVYKVLSIEFFNPEDKRERLTIEERYIINSKMEDSNLLSFKLGENLTGKGLFRSYSENKILESYGVTKEIQKAMIQNPEIFLDYLYLNKEITKEQIEIFYLSCDFKFEISDLELNRYKRNINEINFEKDYILNNNLTLKLK